MNKKEVAKKMRVSKDHDDFVANMKKKYPNYNPVNDIKQKGKESLNRASGRNEGEKMMLGKNENNRA